MDSQLAKKIIIDVQISGWSCLIPASGLLPGHPLRQLLVGPGPGRFVRGLRAGDRQAGQMAFTKLRFADELDRHVLCRLSAFNPAFVLLQPGAQGRIEVAFTKVTKKCIIKVIFALF